MAPAARPTDTFRESLALLRTRRFGTFWFASLLSSIGTWAQQVAQPWLLLSLGASPFLVGLDSFAMSAPVWLLTLPGGVLADRADRRRVIAGFQSVQMLCPVIIVALLLAGHVSPWMIITLSLVVGITDALSMPSFSSIVPTIVERNQIGLGIALNSTQFNVSRIAGPAIAGVLMATVGAVGCFALSALSYLPFIGVALWILPAHVPPADAKERPHDALFAGLGTVLQTPALRGALLTALASGVLCAPLVTFTPVLVRDAFHGSAAQFSLAVSAFGVGGLLGGIAMLGVPTSRDRRRLASFAAFAFALSVVVVSLNAWWAALPLLLALAGVSMTVANTSANTIVQSGAERQLLGRAASLFMLAMRGGIAVGSLVTGWTVGVLGVRHALLLNGALALVAQTAIALTWWRGGTPPVAATAPAGDVARV